jgi:TolB-like protein/class 3 adenylate cyclase
MMERRLAAILATDVVGFSRLLAKDEETTLSTLRDYDAVTNQLVSEHHGRVFGGSGDSVLAEFPSPVQAVLCAIDIQRFVAAQNPHQPADLQMRLRIGVNFGEVIEANDELQGSSINLATRIEGLADPGGIVISEEVHRLVKSHLRTAIEDMGRHRLRGFSEPVQVYRVMDAGEPQPAPGSAALSPLMSARPGSLRPAGKGGESQAQRVDSIRSRKPAIIVLPFANHSGDPQQDYFCHGLTDDLTTELSRFSSLSVISFSTALTYKDSPLRVRDVSRDLGVRYVLEGGVQRTTDRVRINVQLIEAPEDRHLWAERFERPISDLLVLQDEIIERVVAAMALKLEATERIQAMKKPTSNLNAYDAFMRGSHLWFFHLSIDETKQSLLESRSWLEKAKALDPNYGRAWSWLALTHAQEWLQSWGGEASLELAVRLAKQAVAIDKDDYHNHWVLAYCYLHSRQFDLALGKYRQAIQMNRNDANLLAEFAEALVYVGQREEGLKLTRHAMAMNPNFPEWYRGDVAWVYYLGKSYGAAVTELEQIDNPNADTLLILAACRAQITAGQSQAPGRGVATAAAQPASDLMPQINAKRPHWTLAKERRKSPFKSSADLEHWLDGLRKAGLPE